MVATIPRGHSLKRKKAYNRFPKTDMGVPFDCAFQKYYSIAKWICLAEKFFSFNFYENFRCACRFSVLSLLKQAVHVDSPCGISTGKFDSLKTPSKALLSPTSWGYYIIHNQTSPWKFYLKTRNHQADDSMVSQMSKALLSTTPWGYYIIHNQNKPTKTYFNTRNH